MTAVLTLDPGQQTSIGVVVNITATATLTGEGSQDGSSYNTLVARNDGNGNTAATLTASGAYHYDTSGWSYFRLRVSAYTSGTVTVTATKQVGAIAVPASPQALTCTRITNTALSDTGGGGALDHPLEEPRHA